MHKVKKYLCFLTFFAIVIIALLQINVLSFGSIKPKVTNKVSSKNVKKPSTKVITQAKDDGSEFKKPANFTEGVYIKKYKDNYACFKFETPEGIKIITDPFNIKKIEEPDIVTESHQDDDHKDVSMLRGNYKLINTDGEFNEKGIKIVGYPGRHDKGDFTATNFIYVFDINGIRIAHFASQGELPSKELLSKIKDVDILLIQVFTYYYIPNSKLDLKDCTTIVNALKPKIVIPEHGTPWVGATIAKSLKTTFIPLKNGEMVVTRKELDKTKKVKVVELDNY